MILQVGTQAICNMVTNNLTSIDFIWKIWMSNEKRGSIWSYILSKSNENLIMSALVLIINCIRGNGANWWVERKEEKESMKIKNFSMKQ
jgi:hypothetical protein